MLTRRVRQGVFLLRPGKRTTGIVGYVLAVMATKWAIQIHAVCVMSNHWHVCLTDPNGNVVSFQRDCHQFIARALNSAHGDVESVWASGQTSRVECGQPVDLIRKIGYTMANPVKHAAVRHAKVWPGLRRAWPAEPQTFAKPDNFFRGEDEGGVWPESATLVLTRPPGYEHMSDGELGDLLAKVIDVCERKHQRKHDAAGRPFLGRRAVLRQSRYTRPSSPPARSKISPQIACADRELRTERLAFKKHWQAAYGEALTQWRSGDRAAIFPAGTFKMRVVHGVHCAQAPG